MRKSYVIILAVILVAVSFTVALMLGNFGIVDDNPAPSPGTTTPPVPVPRIYVNNTWALKAGQYMGNLHSHNASAGDVGQVCEAYRDHGYAFNVMTDHNVVWPDPGLSGFTFIAGCEEDSSGGQINNINATRDWGPGDIDTSTLIADIRGEGNGNLIQFNHPDMGGDHWTLDELLAYVPDYSLIEVRGHYGEMNTTKYDLFLSAGHIAWLTANDDLHIESEYFKGWNVVNADDGSCHSILEALRGGNFYASTGAVIDDIAVDGPKIKMALAEPCDVAWIARCGRVVRIANNTRSDSYTASLDDMYVRADVRRVSDGARAWTQPMFVEERA